MTITETMARSLTLEELAKRMRDHDDAAVRVLAEMLLTDMLLTDMDDLLTDGPPTGSDREPDHT